MLRAVGVSEAEEEAVFREAMAAASTKCGSLSDPALGEIEECFMAVGHLDVKGTKPQHRAASGSIWPAVKEK